MRARDLRLADCGKALVRGMSIEKKRNRDQAKDRFSETKDTRTDKREMSHLLIRLFNSQLEGNFHHHIDGFTGSLIQHCLSRIVTKSIRMDQQDETGVD